MTFGHFAAGAVWCRFPQARRAGRGKGSCGRSGAEVGGKGAGEAS